MRSRNGAIVFLVSSGVAVVSSSLWIGNLRRQGNDRGTRRAGGEYTKGSRTTGIHESGDGTSETDLDIVKMIYSNIPDIADAITPSADGKTWTLRIKPNLHWQDGEQLTSDDVIFTVESIENPDSESPLAANWQGVTANRMSELEVQFTLPAP